MSKRSFFSALLFLLSIGFLRGDVPCGGWGDCGWDPDITPAHFIVTGMANNVPGCTLMLIAHRNSKRADTIFLKDSVLYTAHGNSGLQFMAMSNDTKRVTLIETIDKHDGDFELRINDVVKRTDGIVFVHYDKLYHYWKQLKEAVKNKAGFIGEDKLPSPLVFLLVSAAALGFFVRIWRQRKNNLQS